VADNRGSQNKNNVFDQVKKKTNISEQQLKSVANNLSPQDLKDEKKVRALIAQVAALARVPVSKEKEDQIVNFLVKNKVNPQQMQSMIQMFMKPKK
jgi:ribosome maturation protein Sdo1